MGNLCIISNRNIRIIAEYVKSKLGSFDGLFEGLTCPTDEYDSKEEFFLNEDEWTTYDNLCSIFRRARELVDEPNFYFRCGASTARLGSWGRFHYFKKIFSTPDDGYRKLPFFNKNFNDTKEIEIILPAVHDRQVGMKKTIIKITNHADIDNNKDYIRDPYLQGIISSIPTLWGLAPSRIIRRLNPYDPEVLFNEEPEFIPYRLDVREEGNKLTARNPLNGRRTSIGERVLLLSEEVNGRMIFLGRIKEIPGGLRPDDPSMHPAILIKDTIEVEGEMLLRKGEIFKAPYFILEVHYDRAPLLNRISRIFQFERQHSVTEEALSETIDQLRRSMRAKNKAYSSLEKANAELKSAKKRLDLYAKELENMVEDRTRRLTETQSELIRMNSELESRVEKQVGELKKYDELRRYLSPNLTEKILSDGRSFGATPKRKLLTVVFSDIRGFSRIADRLESEKTFSLMDRYLSEMIRIAHHYDGTLNKIMGDGLLVFFGDPMEMADHAERALSMAMDMQKKALELLPQWQYHGHDLGIGMGINTGFVTVGNIGSDMHTDYTVIGNQVNVAARLESLAGAGQILISHRTRNHVHNIAEMQEVGELNAKGIRQPIRVYNVLWQNSTAAEEK